MVFKDGFVDTNAVIHPTLVIGEGAIVGASNELAGF